MQERAADKEKYQELLDENSQLQRLKKAAADEAALAGSVSESEEPTTADNRLFEQLTNNAQTRALKLELENRRLMTLIESLKENSFHETSARVLELEKEKKKLSLKIESLNDNTGRLSQQNSDLEDMCKQALEENKKLQNTLKNQRTSFERQQQEYQVIKKLRESCESGKNFSFLVYGIFYLSVLIDANIIKISFLKGQRQCNSIDFWKFFLG